ncbi:Imm8 family immunity protein [Alteromonas sp. P256]|uniref:Imm8 family immunity protein n=1 Tax=Alteromonas sp. P256 TaxID=3117399 RepID=UPI002FE00AFF
MKPKIVHSFCVDHDPIEQFVPHDSSEVDLWFDADIGAEGYDWSNNFQIHLVTQKSLSGVSDKSNLLVIPYYESWEQVLSALENSIRECAASTSEEMFKKIASKYAWEYESHNRA